MAVVDADPSLKKLRNLLGEVEAQELIAAILVELKLAALVTPEDHLRFGEALVRRGGLLEAVGRAIKVRALLHGAKP